jgi:hypothetical protein
MIRQALSGALRLQEEVAELRGMVNVLRPREYLDLRERLD